LVKTFKPLTPNPPTPPPPPPQPDHRKPQNIIADDKRASVSRPPKNWLVESIVTTLICCPAFGIAGIVNASKVDSRYNTGDFEGAEKASKEAGKWTKIGFIAGLVIYVLYFIYAVAVYNAPNTDSSY
jgi:hypothetical protein